MTDTKPVAGYYRVSVARDDMKAPELYTEEIRRYCSYKEFELKEVFSDIDRSGFRGSRPRPALEELKLRCLEFSTIVVPKLARFGRSVKELVELFDFFDGNGVALVFLDMNIDTSTSQGRLLRHIMAAFAEYESDIKADYARANHRLARSKGRPWGQPPFGYRADRADRANRTMIIDRDEAEMIRQIFSSYAKGGYSQYRIARELNEAGKLRGQGAPWSAKQVGRILDNPAYAARCVVDHDLVAANWEPIIDDATWERVREVRGADTRRLRMLRVKKGGPYLLSGMLYCGYCGKKLVHRSTWNRNRLGIYVCVLPGGRWCPGGSVSCGHADDFVTERFLERCHFQIGGKEPATYADAHRQWDKASMLERRSLLSLVISRVVVIAWPGGAKPQRTEGAQRRLEIEWKREIKDVSDVALLSGRVDVPPPSRKRTEGRAGRMREAEVAAIRAAREVRAERSRSYFREWRTHCAAIRGKAGWGDS